MIVNNEHSSLVRLGDYIEIYDVKNVESKDLPFCGINKDKTFMPTVADTNELDSSKYKIVKKDVFVFSGMQTGRDVCIRLALYEKDDSILVSPAYTTFVVKDKTLILPEYLFIQFNRFEMDRYGWFLSDGSIRSNLDWGVFCDIQIPLPEIETQQELVDTYNGLKALAEQNEALIQPLTEACQAYIVDCKKKYPEIELGGYIEEVKTINTERKCTFLRGVGNQGFIDPRQERTNESLNKCTIFHKGDLVYNPSVLFAGAIALNSDFDEAICTEEYVVFHSKDRKILLPEFIFIWLKRKEMGRYFWFSNMDSVRNRIYFEDTCKIGIPLPPPEVQQAIVAIYICAEEAKKIATEAREKMKTLCPALVQRAINA